MMLSGHVTSIFNAMRFDENPFVYRVDKEDKKDFRV